MAKNKIYTPSYLRSLIASAEIGISKDFESLLSLTFTKDNGETFNLSFKDYFTSANTWTIPDDKGPITAEATFMPRNLHSCTTTTHWVLQG